MAQKQPVTVIRRLSENEICRGLFSDFVRRQSVSKLWRKTGGEWQLKDEPFTDDWDEEDWEYVIGCLKKTAGTGGMVSGAFYEGKLKGFVSVEGTRFGSCCQYMDMFCLHVSADMRRQGVGAKLFGAAVKFAREKGAEKLYISSLTSAETQDFYRSMGCRPALEHCPAHADKITSEVQLEYEIEKGIPQ